MLKIISKYTLIAILIVVVSSCKKENEDEVCGYNAQLVAPILVNEGADFELEIINKPTHKINTYYYWHYPDMRDYNATMGDYVADGGGKESAIITDFSIWDVGEYRVEVNSGKEGCEPIVIKSEVNMIPKPCPCEGISSANTLTFSQSYDGMPTFVYVSPTFYFNAEEHSFGIESFPTPEEYLLDIYFNIDPPDYASAYHVLDHNIESVHDFGIDPKLNTSIYFGIGSYPHGYWNFADDQEVFVRQEDGVFALYLCDLLVIGESGEELMISGMIKNF